MTRDIRFSRESMDNYIRDARDLWDSHAQEIYGPAIDIKPDLDRYRLSEEMDFLRIFTARECGYLIGYAIFNLNSFKHNKENIHAYQDAFFIHPKCRGFGAEFLKWCEFELSKDNVSVIFQYVSVRCDYSSMLLRSGYELSEYVYTKRIDASR